MPLAVTASVPCELKQPRVYGEIQCSLKMIICWIFAQGYTIIAANSSRLKMKKNSVGLRSCRLCWSRTRAVFSLWFAQWLDWYPQLSFHFSLDSDELQLLKPSLLFIHRLIVLETMLLLNTFLFYRWHLMILFLFLYFNLKILKQFNFLTISTILFYSLH